MKNGRNLDIEERIAVQHDVRIVDSMSAERVAHPLRRHHCGLKKTQFVKTVSHDGSSKAGHKICSLVHFAYV